MQSRGDGDLSDIDADKNHMCVTADACADALYKWSSSSWWQWDNGSRLMFWRWGLHSKIALLGMTPWISSQLPNYFKRMSSPKANLKHLYFQKLQDVITKGYIKIPSSHKIHNIKSLFDWFGVPKGDSDIRMVYNGTSCGLNEAVWAPNFWLPTAKSAARCLSYNYCFMDKDLGEMFLNFPLHQTLVQYSGVDLSPFRTLLSMKSNFTSRINVGNRDNSRSNKRKFCTMQSMAGFH